MEVADFGDVDATFGVSLGIGSSNANFHKDNVSGSGAKLPVHDKYPSQGGYIIAAVAPDIAVWRDSTTGTPALGSTDWYGAQCAMIAGSAKSENFAIDSIDCGTGLTITLGDGVSAAGKFTDFVDKDQDIISNRWGVVVGSGDAVTAHGLLIIGGTVITEFLDTTSRLVFPDGYHAAGLLGVKIDLGHASTLVQIDCLIIGEGTIQTLSADDTRPDFVVTGTTATVNATFAPTLVNHRNVEFNSKCTVDGADIECEKLTQGSCDLSDTIIRTNQVTQVACLQDPTFGSSTDLHDAEFIQSGVGHAIEISSTGSYDFNNLTFTGYGAIASNDAAIFVNTTAAVTINVIGGSTPSYRTIGTGNVTINNAVTVTSSGTTEGSAVKIVAAETVGTITTGDVLGEGFSNSDGDFSFSINYEGAFDPSGLDVVVRARNQGIVVAAIADDGGVFTDETTEASSNSTGDITLLPATPVVGDAYYFAHSEEFAAMKLIIATALVGTGVTITWEYWNGAWVSLSGVSDGTTGFSVSGEGLINWTPPSDWITTTINSQGPLYFVRARLSALTTITTTPTGSTATLDVSRYFPYTRDRIISATGLSDIATWTKDTISKFTQ